MMNYKTMLYSKQYPVRAGLLGILVTLLVGVAIAFATGFVTPEIIKAQVVGPPCCATVPTPAPTPTPPPPPPPPAPAPAPVPPPPVPVPPPAPAAPATPPLSAICTGAPASVSVGDTVTWNVIASGGDGVYTYSWSGSDGLSGSNPSFGHEYLSSGAKTAEVTVTSDGDTVTASCGVTVIGAPAPLSAVCSASPATVQVGRTVTWNVTASGGTGTYSYSWTGTDGLSGNDPSIGHEYLSAGVKFGEVTVVDSGEMVTASCSVAVTTTPPPTGPACTLTASPTSIAPGENTTLTWTTEDAAMFLLEPGFGMVAFAGGSVTASPSETTTYTGTASSPAGTATCTATVTVSTGGNPSSGGGGGGGGGGSRRSGVTLDMLKLPPEAPFASVYLSQIPYTGLSLTGAGLVVYWIGLIGIIALVSYLILFKLFPSIGLFVGRVLSQAREPIAPVVAPSAPEAPATPAPASVPVAPFQPEAASAENANAYSSFHGFRSFASSENVTIDDIVKGLSRLPVSDFVETASDTVVAAASAGTEIVKDGYRALVRALMARDREAAFSALRDAVRAGEAPERVITQAVCALDDVYRNRIDGAACDPELQNVCAPCDTKELEHMVSSLTTAVDASYSTGVTGAKLALVRALDSAA